MMARFAALVRRRVGGNALSLTPLLLPPPLLRDRQSLRRDEQQTVTVFVSLHFITGADPASAMLLQFFLLVGVEVARTQRLAEYVEVQGEPLDDRVADIRLRVARRASLGAVL